MKFKAVYFDLDGTLIDSKLNFDAMREDLNFPEEAPILEEIEKLSSPEQKARCLKIVHEHEKKGAENSLLIPGVRDLINWLNLNNIASGILTRNSKFCAEYMLKKHHLHFEHVITRDDCHPKPDPAGLLKLATIHQLSPDVCLYVGDYKFDLETAKNAGMSSALFAPNPLEEFEPLADFVFSNYQDFIPSVLLS